MVNRFQSDLTFFGKGSRICAIFPGTWVIENYNTIRYSYYQNKSNNKICFKFDFYFFIILKSSQKIKCLLKCGAWRTHAWGSIRTGELRSHSCAWHCHAYVSHVMLRTRAARICDSKIYIYIYFNINFIRENDGKINNSNNFSIPQKILKSNSNC